jgi:5-methylcytosine-specific restriction endonuclease McrA
MTSKTTPQRKKRSGGIKVTAADRKFSLLIRERDNWTCCRCGKQYVPPTNALHCAHNFTRRTKATRHDEFNAMALCYGCHSHVDSHADEKERLFRDKFGDAQYEATAALAHGRRDRLLHSEDR